MNWLEPFLVSTGIVAVAEIGDKTQLLAFVLSARFKKPWQVILGILAATITNHLLAGVVGVTVSAWVNPQIMRWILGVSFIAMAAWVLIPDREAEGEAKPARFGAFVTTALTFFLLEMGDKTQLATVALSAKYQSLIAVTAGTTLGMMLADVPAVFIGDRLAGKIPLRLVHILAAALFAIIGILVLCGVGG
jgi:Ca2+/H+ antiporter, TMEM165/GDT1 family